MLILDMKCETHQLVKSRSWFEHRYVIEYIWVYLFAYACILISRKRSAGSPEDALPLKYFLFLKHLLNKVFRKPVPHSERLLYKG